METVRQLACGLVFTDMYLSLLVDHFFYRKMVLKLEIERMQVGQATRPPSHQLFNMNYLCVCMLYVEYNFLEKDYCFITLFKEGKG